MSTTNDTTGENTIQLHKQLGLQDCGYEMAYAWLGIRCVTLRRAWRKLVNYVEDTIQDEVEDNITTDVEETLSALNAIPGFGYCNSPDVIEWYQRDAPSSIDYGANVTCASNNELIEKRI